MGELIEEDLRRLLVGASHDLRTVQHHAGFVFGFGVLERGLVDLGAQEQLRLEVLRRERRDHRRIGDELDLREFVAGGGRGRLGSRDGRGTRSLSCALATLALARHYRDPRRRAIRGDASVPSDRARLPFLRFPCIGVAGMPGES